MQPIADQDAAPIRAVPLRRPLRWVAVAVLLVLAAMLVNSLLTNPRYQWGVVAHYLTAPSILTGLRLTLELTVAAMAVGVVGGVLLAVMRVSSSGLVRSAAGAYVWFFRGTPVLVQLIFWYFLQALYPTLGLGIPFGPTFWRFEANDVITPFVAALLGLGLNEAAYMSEIVRGGLLAVDDGQVEAAAALGMPRSLAMRRIVLPQALRVIVPPTGNEVIGMLKTSSLASVLTLQELLHSAQVVYSRTFQTIPLLIVASLWYMVVTTVLTLGQHVVERRLGRDGPRFRSRLRDAGTEPLLRTASAAAGEEAR